MPENTQKPSGSATDGLPPYAERAVVGLITQPTLADAARFARVHVRTLYNLRQVPAFKTMLRRYRKEYSRRRIAAEPLPVTIPWSDKRVRAIRWHRRRLGSYFGHCPVCGSKMRFFEYHGLARFACLRARGCDETEIIGKIRGDG